MAWDGDIRGRFPDWGTDVALARWPEVRSRLSVGQAVRGEVVARAPFGVWVDIGAGHPALLLVPEMAGARLRAIRFEEYPAPGTTVEARVISLGDRAEISLTQNPRFDPESAQAAEPGAAADRGPHSGS
jgi:predicted RNA-binding protein with RPS1 domain